jgi:SecD/SecF fusion protein
MQSKGKLSSILAGVIAVFLILVCGFYLSFTFVNSKYETQAENYAQMHSVNQPDDVYNQAYKHYIDSVGNEKVYLGYTLTDVRKWGVNLGLDLKGGMNVILQVDMPDMLRQLATLKNDSTFEKAIANTNALAHNNAAINDDYVGNFVKEYRKLNPSADLSVIFGNTVKNGANDNQVVSELKDEISAVVNTSATQTLRKRIDGFGVVSPNIQVLEGKDGQILLELPGVKDHDRVRDLLQKSANLEFYATYQRKDIVGGMQRALQLGDSTINMAPLAALLANPGQVSDDYAIIGYVQDEHSTNPNLPTVNSLNKIFENPAFKALFSNDLRLRWAVKPTVRTMGEGKNAKEYNLGIALYALKAGSDGKAALDGEVVKSASSDFDTHGFRGNEVSMEMTNDGAREWARITTANVGKPIAIVLDDRVYSAPNVNGPITEGRSSITGDFSVEEAKDLANVLTAGKMKAKVNIISDMVIGPSLGQQAIQAGMMSFVVALCLLMIFMMAYYGWIPGLIANICLVFNLFFTMGILASFQAVLTLSGICGIVLSLGMAVDANVLIFERAREELRAGKNSRTALADGYSNAFSAIFDSNLTSIITGVILMFFGTGPIKGFATTLIIGLICSFFTAVYLSRLFFYWLGKSKATQNLTFDTKISKNVFRNANYNFLNKTRVSFSICIAMIVIFVGSLFVRGLSQGIDFSGGRNYMVKFDQPVDRQQIEDLLRKEFEGASVSAITIESSNQLRISTNYKIENDSPETEKEITGRLFKVLKPYVGNITPEQFSTTDADHGIVSSQKVGPTVADDMRTEAYFAVTLALIAMFLYILVRFKNVAFSLGALAAVAFTAFSIIGFYSIFWGVMPFAMEIDQSFIAAILTVIGYQINDTVVVFDRVRENIGLYPKHNLYDLINQSINSTLGRTIMTSGSTFMVLMCIFILGGDTIRSFVFAMLLGVVVGTLATIYVASPVAYLTDKRRNKANESLKA